MRDIYREFAVVLALRFGMYVERAEAKRIFLRLCYSGPLA